MPFSFFFSSSGNPLDLHSFPTRRSSDLDVGPSRSAACRLRREGIHDGGHERDHHAVRVEVRHGVVIALIDRKSTRLNSSHTVISYAVFCLKKKKKPSSGSSAASLMPPDV